MSEHFQPLITQLDVNNALNANNAAAQRLLAAKNQANGLIEVENIRLKAELDAAKRALAEAQEITKEWQSAMEAWRDLAQTLRDEVKACPNHEAHKFGQSLDSVKAKIRANEDEARIKHGLKPKYNEQQ